MFASARGHIGPRRVGRSYVRPGKDDRVFVGGPYIQHWYGPPEMTVIDRSFVVTHRQARMLHRGVYGLALEKCAIELATEGRGTVIRHGTVHRHDSRDS